MSYGRIPQDVVDTVLKHHDIVDVVGKYVHLSKQGKYLKGLCPFHSEKTPSFTVTPEKQIFYCYGCQASGTVIQFLMNLEGLSFAEAVQHLAEEAGISLNAEVDAEPTQEQKDREVVYSAYDFASRFYHYVLKNTEEGKQALHYLRARGFSDSLIDFFLIGYAPSRWDTLAQYLEKRGYALPLMEAGGLISAKTDESGYYDRFRDRIMFPIHDFKGKVMAFAGRLLGDGQPKYVNSPESMLFNKSRSLYNFHHARPEIRKTKQIVLFEGYVDVIKSWEAGIHNGVATMGTSLTEHHARLLKRYADEIIVCYDGDDAGQNAAYKSIGLLEHAGCRVKIARIPHQMDPDEYISAYGQQSFVREVMENAVSSFKFNLLHLRKNYKLREDDGKLQYIRAAVKLIAGNPSPTEREHFLKELSAEFQYSLDALKQEMNEFRYQTQKIKHDGDIQPNTWNNERNNRNTGFRTPDPAIYPAYHRAERELLAVMMNDKEVAEYVRTHLGDQFHVEAHAALAAYLYSFYTQGHDPDTRKFISFLQDQRLESVASSISMIDIAPIHAEVVEHNIREIKKVPRLLEIERLKQKVAKAEREGDVALAAQIGLEIITLEKQLKSL